MSGFVFYHLTLFILVHICQGLNISCSGENIKKIYITLAKLNLQLKN